jgi:RNA polymerase sigma factor for flagellar operon FliA
MEATMYTATGKTEKSETIKQYAPMVKRIAHHMMGRLPASVEEDDLIQAGMIGLLDAFSRYDETQNSQFEAYAIQRIRGAMLDELRQTDWAPRSVRQNMRKIEKAINELQHQLGKPPSEGEIAELMGVPLEDYQRMLGESHGHQLIYLDDFGINEDDESFLERNCPDLSEEPLERLMMSLYYEEELNLREIGEIMGVGISRVSQLHSQAIARLRNRLREDKWILPA